MERPSIVALSSRQHPRSPRGHQLEVEQMPRQRYHQRLARRLVCLPLAGLITLLLIGCVGRPQPNSGSKRLQPRGSSALHNLNRGRIGAHPSTDQHHD
jgi:hypothetical protein